MMYGVKGIYVNGPLAVRWWYGVKGGDTFYSLMSLSFGEPLSLDFEHHQSFSASPRPLGVTGELEVTGIGYFSSLI